MLFTAIAPAGVRKLEGLHWTWAAGLVQLPIGGMVSMAGRGHRSTGAQWWRVFLSYTSELREFPRAGSYVGAVEQAVSSTGHVIVDMADFPAGNLPPAELCAERVRSCDVYVGVLGTRYGSPVAERPELSYTELEFEAATQAGLERLVFLLDTEAGEIGIPASGLIDLEYGARQVEFRRRIRDGGLVTQSFSNPAMLGQLLERSLRELAERRSLDSRSKRNAEFRGIFISYRRQESSHFAGRLCDRLGSSFGADRVFMDVDTIRPGVDFAQAISRAVETSDVLLAIIGPQWLAATDDQGRRRLEDPDDIVRLEIEAALGGNVTVIPVMMDDTAMPRRQDLPESLAALVRLNAFVVRHESFRNDAERLVTALQDVIPDR